MYTAETWPQLIFESNSLLLSFEHICGEHGGASAELLRTLEMSRTTPSRGSFLWRRVHRAAVFTLPIYTEHDGNL